MKFLFFSDSHGRFDLPDVSFDALFLLGDIDYYELRHIDKEIDCPKFGVLGNHDAPDYFNNTNIVNLHQQVVTFKGITLAGFQGSPVYKKPYFGQHTEEEVYDFVSRIPSVDIFIAHSNLQSTLNLDKTDAHRGFASFTEYIDKKSPKYFAHGHLHESKVTQIGETTLISVYPYHLLNFTK